MFKYLRFSLVLRVHHMRFEPSPKTQKRKKENNTPDSHLVPHGSTKGASSGLASKFGMGFGALRSL